MSGLESEMEEVLIHIDDVSKVKTQSLSTAPTDLVSTFTLMNS